jgi:hypothetical protein
MGFALWIRDGQAWALGTHEYRPMGVAVISPQGVFSTRDFRRSRPAPSRMDPGLIGLFASLGEMNDFLKFRLAPRLQSQHQQKYRRKSVSRSMPEF